METSRKSQDEVKTLRMMIHHRKWANAKWYRIRQKSWGSRMIIQRKVTTMMMSLEEKWIQCNAIAPDRNDS